MGIIFYLFSVSNEAEANIVVNYVEKLIEEGIGTSKIEWDKIGVITPFRSQKKVITELMKQKELSDISVGTVESFQGQEKEIIIVSLVRSAAFIHDGKYHVGFLSDEKVFFPLFF